MEMPVPCIKCNEIVELNTTRESPLDGKLVCLSCYSTDCNVNELVEEARDIHHDLENNADHMKGDRRGWKRNLKELKDKISESGYSFDDYI